MAARPGGDSAQLELRLVDERTGDVFARFGGEFSRRRQAYVADATSDIRTISLFGGQVDLMRWWADTWLEGYLSGNRTAPIFDLAMTGGRRGGKSAELFTIGVAFALAVPGSITWVVAQSGDLFEEPIAYLRRIMPRAWYRELGSPHWTFFLANGSTIRVLSGHTPGKLKKGRCDLCLINEGQTIPSKSYTTVSASIIDTGGLVVSASNPPDIGDRGEWVTDLVRTVENGENIYGKHAFFDPELNPHADHVALRAMAAKMDKHEYDVQIRGKFLQPPDSVLHAWEATYNERPAGFLDGNQLKDITREFTRYHEGRPFDDIVGVDVQTLPWIAAVRLRVYQNPEAPGFDDAILWGVGEVYVDQGDEVDCAAQLLASGCKHDRTMIITDASCKWQQQQRENTLQRTKYKGGGSMDMFKGEGYQWVVPPDHNMDANPKIVDRVRAANARIANHGGQRLLYIDASRCPRTAMSIRRWRLNKTTRMPSRNSIAAHGGDALTYPVWRFFPRRAGAHNVEVQSIARFGAGSATKGFA